MTSGSFKQCEHCGHSVDIHGEFCGNCGKRLDTSVSSNAYTSTVLNTNPQRKAQESSKRLDSTTGPVKIAIIGAVATILAAIISGTFFLLGGNVFRPFAPSQSQVSPTPTTPLSSTQVLGNEPPIINDSLSAQDSLQWDAYPLDQYGACTFQNNAYYAIATPGNSNSCLATQKNFLDLAIQVNLKIIHGDNGGIIFRSNAKENSFYAFSITTSGSYSLIKSFLSNEGQKYAPLAFGPSKEIKQGLNQPNTLTVIIHGSTFSLYINTYYVGKVSDTSYSTAGLVGVFTTADGGNKAEAAFSNFQVW
jgi:hypothetical protein